MFSYVSVCLFKLAGGGGAGGTPFPGLDRVGTPFPGLDWRVPHPRSGWGVPILARTGWGTPPPPIRQSSIASTCYVAGGMPLAFTQEDLLVIKLISTFFVGKTSYRSVRAKFTVRFPLRPVVRRSFCS